MDSTPTPIPALPHRSPFAIVAIALLLIAGFGWLSVGIPLVMSQLTDPMWQQLGSDSPLPAVFLALGIVSVAGGIGLWRRAGWGVAFVVGTQGPVAVGLLLVYIAVADDWSLLAVMFVAAAAAILTLVDALSRRPQRD